MSTSFIEGNWEAYASNRCEPWPEVVPRDNLLALRREKIVEVGLSDAPGSFLGDDGVNQSNGRLGEDAQRRSHDLKAAAAQLVDRQQRIVFPSDLYVADSALDESRR